MKRIGFLAFEGAEELDLVGPWEMATMWRDYADGPECVMVGQQKGMYRFAKGMSIGADYDFTDCPKLDALLIPGGFAVFEEVKNDVLLSFVRKTAASAEHMLSVCSGSLILQAAGLLEGKSATTHLKAIPILRDTGVTVIEERYVRDGNMWTSAGVSAGIDLMLKFISEIGGNEAADQVQFNSEYYPDGALYGNLHHSDEAPAYMSRIPLAPK